MEETVKINDPEENVEVVIDGNEKVVIDEDGDYYEFSLEDIKKIKEDDVDGKER